MKYLKWLLLCFVLLSVVSCMKEIDLEHLRPAPRLVLNSVMTVGQPVTASLSRTWFYTEDKPNVTLTDANVHLYVNDQLYGQMTWKEGDSGYNNRGYYQSPYLPKQGDRLKITANMKEYKEVVAETIIPEPVFIQKASYRVDTIRYANNSQSVEQRVLVTFQDNPDRSDFYLINFYLDYPVWDSEKLEFTGEYAQIPAYVDYSDDPLFSSSLTALEKIMGYDWLSGKHGRVFTDDLINGKTYTINVSPGYYYIPGYSSYMEAYNSDFPIYYTVVLQTISEGYYRYMKSILDIDDGTLQESLAGSGFAEPIRIYSNVVGGTGILGSSNPDRWSIKIDLTGIYSW